MRYWIIVFPFTLVFGRYKFVVTMPVSQSRHKRPLPNRLEQIERASQNGSWKFRYVSQAFQMEGAVVGLTYKISFPTSDVHHLYTLLQLILYILIHQRKHHGSSHLSRRWRSRKGLGNRDLVKVAKVSLYPYSNKTSSSNLPHHSTKSKDQHDNISFPPEIQPHSFEDTS